MRCRPLPQGPGMSGGFACGRAVSEPRCSVEDCLSRAPKLCDWKLRDFTGEVTGTCDAPLCREHAHSPADGKDLCPQHWSEFQAWQVKALDRERERR